MDENEHSCFVTKCVTACVALAILTMGGCQTISTVTEVRSRNDAIAESAKTDTLTARVAICALDKSAGTYCSLATQR